MSGFVLLRNQGIPKSVKTTISHCDLFFATGFRLAFLRCCRWTWVWAEWRPSGKVQWCQQEGILWYQKSLDFQLLCLATTFSFFATGLNESKVFGGPCKLFFLVVSQCCAQICVITRYICLIYKITASWQLVVWVSGMLLLALSESLSRGSCWVQGLT